MTAQTHAPEIEKLALSEHRGTSFRTIEASNGLIALTLLPELGAKILSLRDLRNAREWLWSADRIPLAHHSYGVSYIEEADTGGWDECFPTVAACAYPLAPYRGVALPDHGELWSQAWRCSAQHVADRIELTASCRAVQLPCEFTRTLSLRAGSVRLDMRYAAHNTGDREIAFIWSAHPLLRVEPGMRLEFPAHASFHVYSATDATTVARQASHHWPLTVARDGRTIALDPLPGPEAGIAFKIWSDPLNEGWTRLIAGDGALQMTFDVREIPQIALWLNAGGWSGIGGAPYYNLALEPCIGAQDSLAEAVTQFGQYARLGPGETRRWSVAVDLETTANSLI